MKVWKLGCSVLLLMVFVFTFTFTYYVAVEDAFAAECECTFWCPYQGSYVGGKMYYPQGQPPYCWSSDINRNCVCYASN